MLATIIVLMDDRFKRILTSSYKIVKPDVLMSHINPSEGYFMCRGR